MQKFIQTYIIFKERVILRIVKLFFHNNLTDSINYNVFIKKFAINNLDFHRIKAVIYATNFLVTEHI